MTKNARRGDEGDVDEEVLAWIFVTTDEGTTSAFQVTTTDTIGEAPCGHPVGRRVIDVRSWSTWDVKSWMTRNRDTTGSSRVENGDMLPN